MLENIEKYTPQVQGEKKLIKNFFLFFHIKNIFRIRQQMLKMLKLEQLGPESDGLFNENKRTQMKKQSKCADYDRQIVSVLVN